MATRAQMFWPDDKEWYLRVSHLSSTTVDPHSRQGAVRFRNPWFRHPSASTDMTAYQAVVIGDVHATMSLCATACWAHCHEYAAATYGGSRRSSQQPLISLYCRLPAIRVNALCTHAQAPLHGYVGEIEELDLPQRQRARAANVIVTALEAIDTRNTA